MSIAPGSAYADHKLDHEAKVRRVVEAQPGWAALLARYSTLYGPGQSRDKAQGLISQFARRIVANEVVHVYVPLDHIADIGLKLGRRILMVHGGELRPHALKRGLGREPLARRAGTSEQSFDLAKLVAEL